MTASLQADQGELQNNYAENSIRFSVILYQLFLQSNNLKPSRLAEFAARSTNESFAISNLLIILTHFCSDLFTARIVIEINNRK